MSAKALFIVASAALLAACSSSQGPTWNAYRIGLPNGQQAYRVDCHGLFEGQDACYSEANKICGKQPVRPIEQIAPLGDGQNPRDVRVLTFQCGAAPQAVQTVSAAPTPAPVRPAPPPAAPKRITLDSDANFDIDQATLTTNARDKLDVLIDAARGTTFRTISVNGYTDSTGTAQHNLRLSERRAQAVAQYLKEHGLHAQAFEVHGYGENDPVATNATAAGRAKNRRVDITLE